MYDKEVDIIAEIQRAQLEKIRLENTEISLRLDALKKRAKIDLWIKVLASIIVPLVVSAIAYMAALYPRLSEIQKFEENHIKLLFRQMQKTEFEDLSKNAAKELAFYGNRALELMREINFKTEKALYRNAIIVFQGIGEPAMEYLIEAFKNSNRDISSDAQNAIYFINYIRAKKGQPALDPSPFIEILADHQEPSVLRIGATFLLLNWGDKIKKIHDALFNAFENDIDVKLRVYISENIGRFSYKGDHKSLLDIYKKEKNEKMKLNINKALKYLN